ncbi:MAG: hypothetical protein LUB59_04980, partial [Candidatus Gastranaerophilales bacterium]|nr:hypothetical protein [Candidatus Gastranaerophilales bacterium]
MRRLQHFLSIIMPVLMFQTCVMAEVCDLFIKNDLYKSQYLLSYNVLDRNFISCDIAAAIFESDNFFIAGIVDKDFSLENDIDIESKKRLRPKADVLNGFKVEEDNSSKCVEKVITPKMKHRRIKNSEIAVDEENIDIDKVDDIKALKKAHKKPKVAKADKPERVSWFGKLFGKKSKTEVVAMQGGNKDITDIDQPEPVKHEVEEELSKNQDIDAIVDIDRVAEVKPVKPEKQPKPAKVKPEKPV